jgi:hypothetical protein
MILFGVLFAGCARLNKQAKAGLHVTVENGGSSVYLNDNFVEKSPFVNRELQPGTYTLKIQPDDSQFVPYETQINLRPGTFTVVTWNLAERPEFSGGVIHEMEPIASKNNAEISFVTIPDGVIINMEGRDTQFAPAIFDDINPGHIEYEVSLPSYVAQKHTINAVAGYRMLVYMKLAKINPNASVAGQTQIIDDETIKSSVEATNAANTEAQITPTPQPTTSPSTQTQPVQPVGSVIKINNTGFFVNEEEVLRVRNNPGGAEIGYAKVGQNYSYAGEIKEGFYSIDFEGQVGWVSTQYSTLITN